MKLFVSLLSNIWIRIALLTKEILSEESSLMLVRGAAGSFAVKLTGASITLCSQIVTARLLGAHSYGKYVYALSLMNLFALLGKLGFESTSLRFIATYYTQNNWGLLKGFLRYSRAIVLISSLIATTIFGFGAWLLKDYLDKELLKTLYIASITLPILATLQVQQQRLRALKKVILAQIPQEVLLPLIHILLLGLISIVVKDYKLQSTIVIAINLIATITALGTISLWFRQNLPRELRSILAKFNSHEWLKTTWRMMLINSFSLVLTQTDIIMLGALSGTEAAGLYTVPNKLSSLIVFVLVSVNSILGPMTASLYAQNSQNKLQNIVSLGVRITFFISAIIAAFIIVFGKKILLFFGEDFSSGYTILILLVVGQLVNSISGPVGLLLNMTGHHDDVVKVLGASAILNILLNSLLVPGYGTTGAAISTVITLISWNIAMIIIVWNRLKIISFAIPLKKRIN